MELNHRPLAYKAKYLISAPPQNYKVRIQHLRNGRALPEGPLSLLHEK